MMSAVAGLVPEVKTIVANAVSLHPVIPRVSRFKLRNLVPLVGKLTPYMNPQWGLAAPERDREGVGADGASDPPRVRQRGLQDGQLHLRHRLPARSGGTRTSTPATHEWVKQEFAHVPLSFFRQMRRCVAAGRLVADGESRPAARATTRRSRPQTDARFAFFAGSENICFLPESQRRTHRWFEEHRARRPHVHVELPGYGHLDVFMGQDAARDVFPQMLAELER